MKTKDILVIVACLIASALLLWLCNFLWDSRYTFGEGDNSIVAAALGKKLVKNSVREIDEILPVNVSYDRALVPVTDNFGIPVGEVDIADREKLMEVLSQLKEYGNYRYIICDIAFNGAYKTPSDSLLFGLIASMPNIVVPGETENLPDILSGHSASSVYKVFHHGEPFLKYHFTTNGEPTIPLRMWSDLTGNDIRHHWWGYSPTDGLLCNNAAVLDLTTIVDYANQTLSCKEGDLNLNEKLVYHLGSDILDAGCPPELFKDKIILIGDFYERDMHDTAIGQVPGIMLLYAAYRALVEGRNRIPWYCYLILFALFFGSLLLIFYFGGWNFKDELVNYILNSISFTIPLEAFNFITLFFGGFAVNAVLIGTIFGFIAYLKNIPRHNGKKC